MRELLSRARLKSWLEALLISWIPSYLEEEAGIALAIPASALTDGLSSDYFFLKPAGQALVVTFLVILPFTQVIVFLAFDFTIADAAGL